MQVYVYILCLNRMKLNVEEKKEKLKIRMMMPKSITKIFHAIFFGPFLFFCFVKRHFLFAILLSPFLL